MPSNQQTNAAAKVKVKPWWRFALWILAGFVLLVLSPLLLLLFLLASLWRFSLLILIWIFWCGKGRNVLFVYSDSPNWQEYIEQNYLPRLVNRAVILNWSLRKKWKHNLATYAFKCWSGYRSFNPVGIVFCPFRKTRVFRFHQPFLSLKHGDSKELNKVENEFFKLLETKN